MRDIHRGSNAFGAASSTSKVEQLHLLGSHWTTHDPRLDGQSDQSLVGRPCWVDGRERVIPLDPRGDLGHLARRCNRPSAPRPRKEEET